MVSEMEVNAAAKAEPAKLKIETNIEIITKILIPLCKDLSIGLLLAKKDYFKLNLYYYNIYTKQNHLILLGDNYFPLKSSRHCIGKNRTILPSISICTNI